MFDLKQMCDKYGVTVRGVIHIGAYEGAELKTYRDMGMARVMFIEANPVVYQRLVTNTAGAENVMAVHCAISDTNGDTLLHVTSADQSSSILKLKRHAAIYPSVVETHQVQVPTRRLDTLLAELKVPAEYFNMMNLDIQGAELMAFKGATDQLKHIDLINTEVNFEELYEGCAMIGQLDEFLGQHQFVRKEVTTPWHPSWGDAIYVKQKAGGG